MGAMRKSHSVGAPGTERGLSSPQQLTFTEQRVSLTPHPGPLPVEGRGRTTARRSGFEVSIMQRAARLFERRRKPVQVARNGPPCSAFSLSPQRGEGRGEG